MPNLGTTELTIIFLICIILFGAGRIGRIGKELGDGIRGFRQGLTDEPDKEDEDGTSN